jgi:flagellin-like hook-associated protein FlgL
MNPLLPDEPGTKVNVCIDNVHQIWKDTAENKSTQLVFCDFSTPKNDGSFNVYDDIRNKLVERGVPKAEIAFIHEYDSEDKKKELFSKVRKGNIRVNEHEQGLLSNCTEYDSHPNLRQNFITAENRRMTINSNLNAYNANNRLRNNVIGSKKASEKLSSGFRINRAGDDAAGIAVSEKMRTQIRGLAQGGRNINDGISLTNTAEGYLNEITAITQRIRELSVQASNGTYAYEDRAAIQLEIDQLVQEIDDITERAEFNGIKLFRGAVGKIDYAEAETITIVPKDPAVATGDVFNGPVRIERGHQAQQTVFTQLATLENAPGGPHFPKEGVFIIRAGIPSEPIRDAVLDFGVLNGPAPDGFNGDFSLDDFREYFIGRETGATRVDWAGNTVPIYENGAFSDWINADELRIEITNAGAITVETTGVGGWGTFVRIGATCSSQASQLQPTSPNFPPQLQPATPPPFNATSYLNFLGLPAGTIFANSAILGANASTTPSVPMIKTSVPLTNDQLNALGFNPSDGSLDSTLAINDSDLWNLIRGQSSFNFGTVQQTLQTFVGGVQQWLWTPNPPFNVDRTFDGNGNLSHTDTINDVIQYINNSPPSAMLSSVALDTPSFFVDRDGFVLVDFSGSTTLTSAYNNRSNPAHFGGTFGYRDSSTSEHIANNNSVSLTSDFPLAVSEREGQLTININNVPGRTVAVNIDFRNKTVTSAGTTVNFTDETSMLAQINNALNLPANHPNPSPRFTNNAYDSINPVATVGLNANGHLVITPAERRFSVNVNEIRSDTPMFVNSRFSNFGWDAPQTLTITGTPDSHTVTLVPGNYANAIEFFEAHTNPTNRFSPYSLSVTEDNRLVITSAESGEEVEINGIETNPWSLRSLFGFGGFVPVTGFTHHDLAYEEELPRRPIGFEMGHKHLWIQGRANRGLDQGMYIQLPYLSASRLMLADFQMPKVVADEEELRGIAGLILETDDDEVERGVNVETVDNSNAAINTIDHALRIVLMERTRFGVATNALEHMREAVKTTHENTTASESRIRDTDMAKMTVEFTKFNILMQAAQAMLTQANQAPQGILQLLA